ncbi:MAG TPA: hypothetical protein VL197_17365 [Nitrospirota bacterium]|nr:hypothetical protein [Nitrospirota bacterium]
MHRKFVSILLSIHLLLIMLVVTFNSFNPQSSNADFFRRGMMLVGALLTYTIFLFLYFRKKVFFSIVGIGTALYFVLNLVIYLLFVIRSQQENSLLIFSATFLPGMYASLSYFIYLMKDRKAIKASV